jgi:hypothetical protein
MRPVVTKQGEREREREGDVTLAEGLLAQPALQHADDGTALAVGDGVEDLVHVRRLTKRDKVKTRRAQTRKNAQRSCKLAGTRAMNLFESRREQNRREDQNQKHDNLVRA